MLAGWSVNRWKKVLFTDESNYKLFTSNRFMCVHCTKGTNQYNSKLTVKTVKHSGHVMVWGLFSWYGRGCLFFLHKDKTMDQHHYLEVLRTHVGPAMLTSGTTIFLQDGAPCNKAKSVKNHG